MRLREPCCSFWASHVNRAGLIDLVGWSWLVGVVEADWSGFANGDGLIGPVDGVGRDFRVGLIRSLHNVKSDWLGRWFTRVKSGSLVRFEFFSLSRSGQSSWSARRGCGGRDRFESVGAERFAPCRV